MLARYRKYETTNLTAAMEYLLSDLNDTSRYRSVQNFDDNAINPCIPSTYSFVEHIIREIIQMHQDIQPLQVFHFGGDEVPEGAWEDSPECERILGGGLSTNRLQQLFVRRVSVLANAHGLDLAGWEDGLMRNSDTPYNRSIFPNENVYGYFWNNIWDFGRAKRAYVMANAGYKVRNPRLMTRRINDRCDKIFEVVKVRQNGH